MTVGLHKFPGLVECVWFCIFFVYGKICNCDMRPWFLHYPEIVGCPLIRLFTLTDPWDTLEEDAVRGLVKLVEAQDELGCPSNV